MTHAERVIIERGIRQLRFRVNEQRVVFGSLGYVFPGAFLDAIEETLQRFEYRLSKELISGEVSPAPSSPVCNQEQLTITKHKTW